MVGSAGISGGDFVTKFCELIAEKYEILAILNEGKISKLARKQLELQLKDIEWDKRQMVILDSHTK